MRGLDAPALLMERDLEPVARLWESPEVRALAEWPEDVRALAAELLRSRATVT